MRRLQIPVVRLPGIWFAHHLQGALCSLGRLRGTPLPTLMTVFVIGIALALPGALYVLTRNLERLGEGWEQTAAISLFLKSEVSATKAEALARRLAGRQDLESVTLISPDQALDELRAETGFAEAVEQLETNPLPYVLALRPAQSLGDAASLEGLREVLTALPETDLVRMDTLWVRRFQGVILLGERAAQVLASALALGVLLVIGNTIRLEIENRRQEIVIMETVGATHAFIRRPFLWLGVWYGFLGGLIAWCLVSLALFFMQSPVSRLAALYQADFLLVGLGPLALAVLLGGSLVLGLAGSWIAVSRHLAAIEPG
ncbi:MAG: permease-like cell division protein FtsX [Chromatiaceae bacterium]